MESDQSLDKRPSRFSRCSLTLMHELAPPLEYVPYGHGVQLFAPAPLYVSFGHFTHCPFWSAYPGLHTG